jgi:hypothetical protein
MGYFQQAVANLKRLLEDHPRLPKLAQVQRHLILSSLLAISSFDDPYSMDFETQRALFLHAVQRTRRDIDAELVEEIMPRDLKRVRLAYIGTLRTAEGGPASVIEQSSVAVNVSLGP